jgi:large subunit ribosomal protein L21
MATAVIRTGGKQYRVAEGDTLRVEKLAGSPGDTVAFEEVLLIDGDEPKFGRPLVDGAKVEGEILKQDRAKKVVVFKFKRRKKHRVKAGHRQDFTAVKITSITG